MQDTSIQAKSIEDIQECVFHPLYPRSTVYSDNNIVFYRDEIILLQNKLIEYRVSETLIKILFLMVIIFIPGGRRKFPIR